MKPFQAFLSYWKTHPSQIFPSIVVLGIVILTSLGISGTSSGIIYRVLYGDSSDDSSLIFGRPQAIRSDEFLVNTQLTLVQVENGMPRFNKNIDNGKDMSIIVDVPYKEWSALFKPQNLGFFFLPVANAFALKWWLLLGLLLISIYYFSLRFLRNRVLLSSLVAIALSSAPFIWWWYQTGTNATIYYAFFILLVTMNIVERSPLRVFSKQVNGKLSIFLQTALLSYLFVCYALILYPPFQLPVVLVGIFFMIGFCIHSLRGLNYRIVMQRLTPLLLAAIIALGIVAAFLASRTDTIKAVTETAYPGKRAEGSGGYDGWRLLSTYLQPQLQRTERGAHYFVNQSESANFLIHPLFLLVPSVILAIALYYKKKEVDWILVLLIFCNLLFLIHLFVPEFSELNRFLFLQLSPPLRAIIGYGMLGMITLIYTLSAYSELQVTPKSSQRFTYIFSLLMFGLLIFAGYVTSRQYPQFISNPLLIVLLAFIFTSIFYFFILKKYLLASVILAIYSISSIAFVHPLYRGMGPVDDQKLLQAIRQESRPQDLWGYSGLIYFENSIQMAKRDSITGTIFYPNIGFWQKYATDPSQQFIYNRYAHVLMTDQPDELRLLQPDLYMISYRCNMDIMRDVDFILSTVPVDESCVSLLRTVKYPNVTFYIYKNQQSQ